MKKLLHLTKMLLVMALLGVGQSVWATDVPYKVGTEGTGDEWANRKYSDAYEIAPGEVYHFTFTNTSYGVNNYNNWLLDCKATSDTSVDDWFFTMRSDNYGWGANYNATMRYSDFVWDNFRTVMNGATVDMYVDYSSNDKIIRTYATITSSDDATIWHYNFASTAIDRSSVFLFLSEELAVLNITTAEKVASIPIIEHGIYKRSTTSGCAYTWDTNTAGADYTGWTVNYGTKSLDNVNGIKWTGTKTSGLVSTTITPSDDCLLNLEADFFLKGATGSQDTRPDEAYFRFGNIYIFEDAQYNKLSYVLDGTTTVSASGDPIGTTFFTGTNSNVRNTGVNCKVIMEINTATDVLKSLKVYTHGDNVTPKLDLSEINLAEPNYTVIGAGNIRTRSSGEATASITNITITETPQIITAVDYTVKFQDALGNTLKDDVVYTTGAVGEVYRAFDTDMETFYSDDETKKYIYKSGQNTETLATSNAEDNVIILVFDVYEKTAYTLKAQVSGSDLTTLDDGSTFFDGSTTKYWSKYIKVGDNWYVADETTYGKVITSATNNVAFSAASINYFFEFENMDISRTYGDGYTGTARSNGRAVTLYASSSATTSSTVAAGVYEVSMDAIKWGNYDDNYLVMYSSDKTNWKIAGTISYSSSEEGVKTLANVIIPTSCYIRIQANNGSQTPRRHIDYITLTKTADLPANESIEISGAGFATYVSNYDLNFSTTEIEAYKVKVSEKGIARLTKVDNVPAGTPVLLYKEGGATESIPVMTGAAAVSDNDLVAGNDAAVATTDGEYTNMILNNVSGIGFYFANGQTVAANRAYLHILTTLAPDAAAGSRMMMVFEDEEVTGIKSIDHSQLRGGDYYNLSGQRVAKAQKGLYIVNGKKVVIK